MSKCKEKEGELPYRRGVGALLFRTDGLVFVARRIDTPGDAWQLPQGGIDDAEKPRRAVLRELKEEIGTDRAEIIGNPAQSVDEEFGSTITGGRIEQRTDTDVVRQLSDPTPSFDAAQFALTSETAAP